MEYTGIYIYIDGSDNSDIVDLLLIDLEKWKSSAGYELIIVNELHERTPDMAPEDLPDWHLGLNIKRESLSLPVLESISPLIAELALRINREFVVGYYNDINTVSEDIIFVDGNTPGNTIASTVWEFLEK